MYSGKTISVSLALLAGVGSCEKNEPVDVPEPQLDGVPPKETTHSPISSVTDLSSWVIAAERLVLKNTGGPFEQRAFEAEYRPSISAEPKSYSVALISAKSDELTNVYSGDPGDYCEGSFLQHMRSKPHVAECTGFLIGQQTVLTTKHCLSVIEYDSLDSCVVFGYSVDGLEKVTAAGGEPCQDLKNCSSAGCPQVLESTLAATGGGKWGTAGDWAILRLNDHVEGASLFTKFRAAVPATDQGSTMLHYPLGLPVVENGFEVCRVDIESGMQYSLTSVAYGSSGAPMFVGDECVGMHVRGGSGSRAERPRCSDATGEEECYSSCEDTSCPLARGISGDRLRKIVDRFVLLESRGVPEPMDPGLFRFEDGAAVDMEPARRLAD